MTNRFPYNLCTFLTHFNVKQTWGRSIPNNVRLELVNITLDMLSSYLNLLSLKTTIHNTSSSYYRPIMIYLLQYSALSSNLLRALGFQLILLVIFSLASVYQNSPVSCRSPLTKGQFRGGFRSLGATTAWQWQRSTVGMDHLCMPADGCQRRTNLHT